MTHRPYLPPFVTRDRAATVAAIVVAGALLWAATLKALDLEPLVRALVAYRLATPATADLVAAAVTAAEFVLGATILSRTYRRPALIAATALLTAFAFVLARALALGLTTDCGCFGAGNASFGAGGSLALTSGLVALALVALALRRARDVDSLTAPDGAITTRRIP